MPTEDSLKFPSGRSVKRLRQDAKALSKDKKIHIHQALDIVAQFNGGIGSWSESIRAVGNGADVRPIGSNLKQPGRLVSQPGITGEELPASYPGHPPYIPVLKWQRGEQRALKELDNVVKGRILPCIDIRLPDQHEKFIDVYKTCWGRPALVDYADPEGFLTNWRSAAFKETLNAAASSNLPIIPVLNPQDTSIQFDADLMALVKRSSRIALRFRLKQLHLAAQVKDSCNRLLNVLQGYQGRVTLILDHGVTPNSDNDDVMKAFIAGCAALQQLAIHELVFISGAYPDQLPKNDGAVLMPPRRDWALWKKLHALQPSLKLGFGDYGILSPLWTEEVLIRRPNVSIRYADSEQWLIIRGQAKTKQESINISKILVSLYSGVFRKIPFSFGDSVIGHRADDSKADKEKRGGNEMHVLEGWNHHISLVVKEQYY